MKKPNTKHILMEFVEPDINEPAVFDTYEEAYAEMKRRLFDTLGTTEEEFATDCGYGISQGDTGLSADDAWCQNKNHDNCTWHISEIEI